MHGYFLFDVEMVRLALVYGIVISIFAYNQYGMTTGGAITPGYLGLFFFEPIRVIVTLLIALCTYLIVHRFLRPRNMLWGRKLFESEILITLVLQVIWFGLLTFALPTFPEVTLFFGIGFLIPGIIAHDMGRQGSRKTLTTTTLSAAIVFCLILITSWLQKVFSLPSSPFTSVNTTDLAPLTFPIELLYVGILLSVFANILLNRGKVLTILRTGGFVTAAYLALMLSRPLDIFLILIGSGVTYLIVTQMFMKQTILFGRNKMAVMVLVGMIVTWVLELGVQYFWHHQPWPGFNIITPMIVALLANDAERQTPMRTLMGVGLATFFVFIVLVWF